ncbi:MAG: alpha/beta fold hydrolase [Gemmatimonadota bacterium]|nr:alpha/beta fold hydrolase [Gemmatimonadota bacterium]MDH5758780.1 alpha/beta fold hydrolase [Gemmatimonadota bacterium]
MTLPSERPGDSGSASARNGFTLRPFRPARWAPGPNAQTLVARGLRSRVGPPLETEAIHTPDGDMLYLDWTPDPGRHAPVVLVLHGLEGSSRRSYVIHTCRALHDLGMWAVALNFRGCGPWENALPRFYHSGETGDPGLVLRTLRARHPRRKIGALGFSLGGNVLLKLLGERSDGGAALVDAAVAMSVPYDLAAGGHLLEHTGWGRLYSTYFLRSLKKKVMAKQELLRGHVDLDRVMRTRTLREFDDAATAPLHGFRDAADYYARSSSQGYLSGVRIPTLLLHSEDDPFLPPTHIPREAMAANSFLTAGITSRGGHVGFLAGTPRSPVFWADEEGVRFLAHHLDGRG